MSEKGKTGRKRIEISDASYKRLTIFNTAVFIAGILLVLIVAIMKRESISYRLEAFLEHETLSSKVVGQIKKMTGQEAVSGNFPSFGLAIDSKHLRNVEKFIHEAITQGDGILLKKDKIWYPGRFIHDGEVYKVKVRIRGDLSNHWKDPKKSLRIKFNTDKLFKGYRNLNLVIPSDKAYEIEPVVLEKAREMGLLVPDAGFARVHLNQVNMGLYYWYEQPGKEMLEKLNYPQGEMFSTDDVWMDTFTEQIGVTKGWELYPGAFQSSIQKKGGKAAGKIQQRWERLLELARDADDAEFSRAIPFLVDLDKFTKWNALIWLFGGVHPQLADNLRWYYDTTIGLFEPITYDVIINKIHFKDRKREGAFDSFGIGDHLTNLLVLRILRDRNVMRRRNEILYGLLGEQSIALQERLDLVYGQIREGLGQGLGSNRLGSMDLLHKARMDIVRGNVKTLREWLEYGRVFVESEIDGSENDARITFRIFPDSLVETGLENILLTPSVVDPAAISINKVTLISPDGMESHPEPLAVKAGTEGLTIQFKDLDLWTGRNGDLRPKTTKWTLTLDLGGVSGGGLEESAYPLFDLTFTQSLSGARIEPYRVRKSPTRTIREDDSLSDPSLGINRFLTLSPLPFRLDGSNLVLAAGSHILRRDMVIPAGYGLVLEPGGDLKMGPGASIVSHRALHIRGTAERPVKIGPLVDGQPWGVIGVSKASATSTVSHLEIGGGSEKWINGIYFSGQLCFYRSSVRISDSNIRNGGADDGLNIKHGNFEITDSRFLGNSSDGFDGDWVDGVIRNTEFTGNGGDGIDLSGSDVVVVDSRFSNMGDKAISVGERTRFYALNVSISGSSIGIASKDLSTAHVLASTLKDNGTALAAYRKKAIFGGADLEVLGSLLWGNKKNFEVDGDSTIRLVGVGMEKPHEAPRVENINPRIGEIGRHFGSTEDGSLVPGNEAGGPFAKGPETKEKTVLGVTMPNLATLPVGMRRSGSGVP